MFEITEPSSSYWDKIHSLNLDFGPCWKKCNSYCCNTNSEEIQLSLMKKNSAGMVFMPSEYKYLEQSGKLQEGFQENMREHTVQLEDGIQFDFITSVCSLNGICSNCNYRPLICKLYPFYPIFNLSDGTINNFITGSAIDQYWSDFNISHPCWLVSHESEKIKKTIQQYQNILNHPYLIFYFNVAATFMKAMSFSMKQKRNDLFNLDIKSFFSHWEIIYLTGSLLDKDKLKEDFLSIYQSLMNHG